MHCHRNSNLGVISQHTKKCGTRRLGHECKILYCLFMVLEG
jgi:hypothetical protein